MRRFKEVRKEFERSSECLEGAQARNAQAPRGKQHEVEEASNALLNARRAFRSEALDYVLQVRDDAAGSAPYLASVAILLCFDTITYFIHSISYKSGLHTNIQLPKESHALAVLSVDGLALALLPGPVVVALRGFTARQVPLVMETLTVSNRCFLLFQINVIEAKRKTDVLMAVSLF